jgi:hypothetical protein
MDNARLHNLTLCQEGMEVPKAEGLPHPAYGLEIAPSDFLPVGDMSMKKRLT